MFFFEMRKRTKKRGGLRFPPHHPKRPLAKQGVGSTKNNRQKGFEKFWLKTFSFVFLFYAVWLTRRVKAKNASTLGFYNTKTWLIAINHKNVIQFAFKKLISWSMSFRPQASTPRPLGRNLIKPFYCFILIFIL